MEHKRLNTTILKYSFKIKPSLANTQKKMAHTSKMESQWRMPEKGWVKLNVHGYYTPEALTNGNKTGVGAVLRNDQGKIVKMLTGTQSVFSIRSYLKIEVRVISRGR
ncbi:hypothetical protein AgCh_015029 [Apium graveolens]